MKKRILVLVLAIIVIAAMFTGCAASMSPTAMENAAVDQNDNDGTVEGKGAEAPAAALSAPAASSAAAAASAAPNQSTADSITGDSTSIVVPNSANKIILTQYLTSETKNFDSDIAKLNAALKTSGGYFQQYKVDGTKPDSYDDAGRTASFVFRIPRQQVESFLSTAKSVGVITSSSGTAEDITKQYVDTESRLKTLRTRLERLQALEAKATKMADIVELEKDIQEVTYEIESLEGQLKGWDNLVDYATVQMTVNEVNTLQKKIDEPKPNEPTYGQQISNGFNSVLSGVIEFFKTLGLILMAGSPVIIPLAVIALAIIFGVKLKKKKNKNNTTGV